MATSPVGGHRLCALCLPALFRCLAQRHQQRFQVAASGGVPELSGQRDHFAFGGLYAVGRAGRHCRHAGASSAAWSAFLVLCVLLFFKADGETDPPVMMFNYYNSDND